MGLKIQLIYLKFHQSPLPESKRLLASVKGSKYPEKSRICCLCQRPSETRLGQRQQISREIKNVLPLPETLRNMPRSKAANIPRNQEYVAFARDPKKHATVKGSKSPEKSRKCCLCRRPEETRLGQRQQKSREIKNVLPLPETLRNMPRSKAANIPRNQEYVAFARDPKKHATVKGSKCPEKSRKCCLSRRPSEMRLGQRQQISREIKNVLPLPKT